MISSRRSMTIDYWLLLIHSCLSSIAHQNWKGLALKSLSLLMVLYNWYALGTALWLHMNNGLAMLQLLVQQQIGRRLYITTNMATINILSEIWMPLKD